MATSLASSGRFSDIAMTKQTGLHFLLMRPEAFRALVERRGEAAWGELVALPGVGTLRWPGPVEMPMLELLRDVLLRAHAGSAARAWSTLRRPYQGVQWPHPHSLGCVTAQERHRFLGGRPPRLTALPRELQGQVALEPMLAALAGALEAFRQAPPEVDLLLVSLAEVEPT